MRIGQLLAIGVITLGTLGQAGWGQTARTQSSQPAPPVRQIEDTSWIDIRFDGGTVKDLVDAIKARMPRANILLEPAAADVQVPAFEAFGVTPAGALEVARNILPDPGSIDVLPVSLRGDNSAPSTSVRLGSRLRHQQEQTQASRTQLPADNAPSRAWNLRNFVAGEAAIDSVLAAIQAGMETFETNSVVLKYHEPTGVLMVRGYQAQITFIESIIEAAAQGVVHSNSREDIVRILREVEREKEQATDAIMILQAKVRVAAEAVGEARSSRAAKTTIGQAEVDLLETEAELKAKVRELEQIEQTIARLKAQLEEFDSEKSDR